MEYLSGSLVDGARSYVGRAVWECRHAARGRPLEATRKASASLAHAVSFRGGDARARLALQPAGSPPGGEYQYTGESIVEHTK